VPKVERLLRPSEIAELVGCGLTRAYEITEETGYVLVGRKGRGDPRARRVRESALAAWIAAREVAAGARRPVEAWELEPARRIKPTQPRERGPLPEPPLIKLTKPRERLP
jgi:hypothetical protein